MTTKQSIHDDFVKTFTHILGEEYQEYEFFQFLDGQFQKLLEGIKPEHREFCDCRSDYEENIKNAGF